MALSTSYAQDTLEMNGKTYTSVDTTALTAREVYTDAKEGIAGLAKALKAPAEHVYTILVKQQIVNAIVNFLIPLVMFIFAVWGIRRYYLTPKDRRWSGGDGISSQDVFNITVWCLGIAAITLLCANLPSIVLGFVNPEYGAIKDIFEFVKGGH